MPFTRISLTELGDPKTMAVADVDSRPKTDQDHGKLVRRVSDR